MILKKAKKDGIVGVQKSKNNEHFRSHKKWTIVEEEYLVDGRLKKVQFQWPRFRYDRVKIFGEVIRAS